MKTYIIDDEYISIYLTKYTLATEGFSNDITSFQSAEEALKCLLEEIPAKVPQLIFLDLNMPGMDGWEFLDELTAYQEHLIGRCRIYILTSSLATTDMTKANEIKLVNGFIHKPIDRDDLEVIFQTN